ncbi:DnaJ/Hsp40 cysteine-rich domain superfamily protein isoform 1 [Tripterygium wilfordii]|uniref:DnaJ/Hsp40 cysteine-rich domain superfamily protein isoform 1 n=2 Tax=Tripterygium wilfordii TaxID=458696 RepID=A0A7J7CM81_TRIWF|nr:DnaJ/Hsp40 cysteine-rich domain superfamily protein isoform 1 [Tripterygium wilfordii]
MTSSNIIPVPSSPKMNLNNRIPCGFRYSGGVCIPRIRATALDGFAAHGDGSSSVVDMHRKRSSLESLFCYDKPIPEERIEKPVGVSIEEKLIGDNSRCTDCQAKGAVLCATCSGSGLYVDSILESQGIIVKVRCLGCGGTGNIMCSECGGRGHLGPK